MRQRSRLQAVLNLANIHVTEGNMTSMSPGQRSWKLLENADGHRTSGWSLHRALRAVQQVTYLQSLSEAHGQGLAVLEFLLVVLQAACSRQREGGEGGEGEVLGWDGGGGKTNLWPVTKQQPPCGKRRREKKTSHCKREQEDSARRREEKHQKEVSKSFWSQQQNNQVVWGEEREEEE